MRPNLERRIATGSVELRKATTGGAVSKIGGLGALFNQETVIGGWFRELIRPGAFAPVIGVDADVRSLFNHSADCILGRTTAGTLRVSEDAIGLRYEADVNQDDPMAVGVAAKIARGDVTGSSFGFRVKREEWIEPDDGSDDLPLRIIHEFAELQDVGPVTFPAYEGATAEARSAVVLAIGDDTVPAKVRERISRQIDAIEPRAGRVLSAANEKKLTQARDLIDGVVQQVNEQKSARPSGDQRQEGAPPPADAEDSAELVQYQTLAVLLTQAGTSLTTAVEHVQALIAAEAEGPAEPPDAEAAEEAVESARLTALLTLCAQICGACHGVAQLAQAMLDEDEDAGTPSDPMARSRAAEAVSDADRNRRLRLASACR